MNVSPLSADAEDSLEKVLTDTKKGIFHPCYLLYGEEEFLIKDALDKIISLIIPDSDRDLNLFIMDSEQEDLDYLCQTLITPPLITSRKLVLLKNTRMFFSVKAAPDLIEKIRENISVDQGRAAIDFMRFLKTVGWRFEDMKDDGWKRISDDEWRKATGGDEGIDRATWLPAVVEICINKGIEEAKTTESGVERLASLLKDGLLEGNHLIITANTVDKRKKIFKTISETGKVIYFPKIKGEARQRQTLIETTRNLLAEAGKTLTPAAWVSVGQKTGFDVGESMRAIEKLIVYTGERQLIKEEDVEEVVSKTKEGTVFDLTNAIGEKDINRALVALKELFDQSVNEILILSMIAREIRHILHALLLIKSGKLKPVSMKTEYGQFQKNIYPGVKNLINDDDDLKDGIELLRQHPYVIYNSLKNSSRFSFNSLVGFLSDLVEMDIALKSTSRNPKLMLESLVIKICE